jgi:hypothetical protein
VAASDFIGVPEKKVRRKDSGTAGKRLFIHQPGNTHCNHDQCPYSPRRWCIQVWFFISYEYLLFLDWFLGWIIPMHQGKEIQWVKSVYM